jgi:hypothetical protein
MSRESLQPITKKSRMASLIVLSRIFLSDGRNDDRLLWPQIQQQENRYKEDEK